MKTTINYSARLPTSSPDSNLTPQREMNITLIASRAMPPSSAKSSDKLASYLD